ncbi:MAG: FkbM family methyltransferase [Opitutus sp.]
MSSAVLRKFVHRTLRKIDRKIVRVRPGEVTGVDLQDDLGLTIPGDEPVCFDVGANQGQTIRMLQRALKRPRIHVFEPSSATFAQLTTQWFPRGVSFHQCALGDKPAHLEFINYQKSTLSSLLPLDPHPENRFHHVDVVDREMVEVSTVDDFMARHDLPALDLLKVDTQGFDFAVLKGPPARCRVAEYERCWSN